MKQLDSADINNIAKCCINLYNKLPITGKPVGKEWTVLSCVVQHEIDSRHFEVVSLGTGSKCIGASKLSPRGDILNDSHAEVMARRGFLLYLYNQINKSLENAESIFIHTGCKFKLKNNIKFIFYSSQLPCGDASIIPKDGVEEHFGDVLKSQKRPANNKLCDIEIKAVKESKDVHRTGAKCLPNAEQDPKTSGINYHLSGQVRTKPGRGDRTLSVSCSDKMARWVHCGIQGSLLDLILHEPLYISCFIFGAEVKFSQESLRRAFLNRSTEKLLYHLIIPEIYQCSEEFPHIRKNNNVRPAAASIVWSKAGINIFEVAVQGKKMGVTKKKMNLPSSALAISKFNLYKQFLEILRRNKTFINDIIQDGCLESIPYNEMKRKSVRYKYKWKEVKSQFFKIWTVKPDMWNFTCGH